jgi:opacity protein-like surface antigen
LASVRGRLGYTVMPNFLLFVTGGIAWEHSAFSGLDAGMGDARTVGTRRLIKPGRICCRRRNVVGGGIDWAPWSNNWIFRLEYLHYQFGGASSAVFFGPINPIAFNWGNLSVDSIRAGLSYKF